MERYIRLSEAELSPCLLLHHLPSDFVFPHQGMLHLIHSPQKAAFDIENESFVCSANDSIWSLKNVLLTRYSPPLSNIEPLHTRVCKFYILLSVSSPLG